MTLDEFECEERARLVRFVAWYNNMAQIDPEHYPLELEKDNSGVWFEMFDNFEQ